MYGDSYTCEHRITYRLVESLCHTPESNLTLGVNYISIKKAKNIKGTIKKVKKQKQNERETIVNYTFRKDIVSKIYKELFKCNKSGHTAQLEWAKDLNRLSPKGIHTNGQQMYETIEAQHH